MGRDHTPTRVEELAAAWWRATAHVTAGVREGQEEVLAAMGATDRGNGVGDGTAGDGSGANGGGADAPAVEASEEWQLDRTVTDVESLGVGDVVRFTKSVTDADVERFARASGDTNPLHLDPEYAEETMFGGRIVHGTLAAGVISAALANLPGLVVYLAQDVEFLNPVEPGDVVTATVEVVEDLGGGRYRVETTAETDAHVVIAGEATVMIRPDDG